MMLEPLCDLRVICTYVMIQPFELHGHATTFSSEKIVIFSNQVTEVVMV